MIGKHAVPHEGGEGKDTVGDKRAVAEQRTGILNVSEKVKEFGRKLQEGIGKMYEACRLYVEVLDVDPGLQSSFEEAYPGIPAAAWRRFEAVGRRRLHIKLLTAVTCRQLERCAYEEQEKYVEGPVDVMLFGGDVLKVEVKNLTAEQARQVFAKDHVRTMPEQRAYIESLKTMDSIKRLRKEPTVLPYRVSRHRLVVGDVAFTREDLLRILVEMEK